MTISSTLRTFRASALLAMATTVAAVGFSGPAQADAFPYGQDVSNYQPRHDWATSGADFGIVKASEGLDYKDPTFARHWKELDKHKVVRGAYHFGHPANDPVAEADYFLAAVNGQPAKPGDLLALDLETSDGQSTAHVNAWASSRCSTAASPSPTSTATASASIRSGSPTTARPRVRSPRRPTGSPGPSTSTPTTPWTRTSPR
jgi:GH25 family lysozyme M1 (1,4-beta-N-acetylmuramidase)